MRAVAAAIASACMVACSAVPDSVDPGSDAPDVQVTAARSFTDPASYAEALEAWRNPEDVNAWIGARFQYDTARARRLSETQRQKNGRLPILEPGQFFATPTGVCVDVARFAVETLRTIDPAVKPAYVMIEFDPVTIGGDTLRRHWMVSFERDGGRYFFADSKRPGHIAGPYASTQAFIDEYARYRGRRIVSFSERESYERRLGAVAARQSRAERP